MDEKNFKEWLIDFRERMKDTPISMDDIAEVVEEVRKRRYEQLTNKHFESSIEILWDKIGKQIKASGMKQKDIARIIKEVRQANKKK